MDIDLNKPAFGPDSQKITPEEEPKTATTETTDVEPEVKTATEEEPSVEESKVPYSRFKKFHDRALEAEREAQEWRSKAESLGTQSPQQQQQSSDDLPAHWVKLYGDSDASKEAWQIQHQQNEALKQEAREEAIRAVRNERYEETARTNENVDRLDENFEDLSALVGRDLNEKEQSAVLDIVDDYTPKDDDGNYLGAILPFQKAWEIYELKQQASKAPKIQARNSIASLSGNKTQGEPSVNEEKNKNFDPLNWDSYKKLL